MRALPLALAVSAVVHTGAIAWVGTHPQAKREPPKLVTIETIQILPPEPAPTVVALLDDHSVATPGPAPSTPRNTRKGARRIVTTERAVIETPPPVETPPPPRNTLMAMRHEKKKPIDTGLSQRFWEKFAERSPPIIDQSIGGVSERLGNPNWVANASPEELTAERAKLVAMRDEQNNAELKPDGAGTKSEHRTFKMRFNADGTVKKIDDKANMEVHGLTGSFDVSDMMMRRQGIDPYSSYKLKVLDETREQRYEMGKRYRTGQLAQSRQHMQKNLERLVASAADTAALKQGLFELWDDCAETGSAELVAGGRSAREFLIGFLRSRLPAGSAGAYTHAELARFNKQRKSRTVFAPYEQTKPVRRADTDPSGDAGEDR